MTKPKPPSQIVRAARSGPNKTPVTTAVNALRERFGAFLESHRRPPQGTEALGVPKPKLGVDHVLCGAVLVLAAIGTVMVFSAGAAFAARAHGDMTYFLKRQVIYVALGLCAFALGLRVDYSFYRRITYPMLFVSVGLLAAVLVAGHTANNATRWFRFGPISFQPSEVVKFTLAVYLAVLLARKAEAVRRFSVGFLPPLVMTGVICLLLLKQPDLGTSMVLCAMALALLFVAGTRTSYIAMVVLAAVPLGWKFLIMGSAERMGRVMAFLEPFKHRQHEGYQLTEALISIGAGGFFGGGLGASKQKMSFLPEAHTDFILAIVGEELGFFGILCLLVAFGVLVWRGLSAAARARDVFGSYLAFALSFLFGLQALFNMAVVLGLVPTKGLALPFISYGGTALIVSLFMAGVLGNISARNPEPRAVPLLALLRRKRVQSRNRRSSGGGRVVVLTGKRRAPSFASAIPAAPLSAAAPAPVAPLQDGATTPDAAQPGTAA